jgi:hypothetical protein
MAEARAGPHPGAGRLTTPRDFEIDEPVTLL